VASIFFNGRTAVNNSSRWTECGQQFVLMGGVSLCGQIVVAARGAVWKGKYGLRSAIRLDGLSAVSYLF